MGFKLFFWNSDKAETENQEEKLVEANACVCGRNLAYTNCHELEFALPITDRGEAD